MLINIGFRNKIRISIHKIIDVNYLIHGTVNS